MAIGSWQRLCAVRGGDGAAGGLVLVARFIAAGRRGMITIR